MQSGSSVFRRQKHAARKVQEQTAGAGGRSSIRQEDQNLSNFEKEMKSYATSQGFRDLKVYRLAFRLAMEIFHESKHFPREEKLLIDGSNFAERREA